MAVKITKKKSPEEMEEAAKKKAKDELFLYLIHAFMKEPLVQVHHCKWTKMSQPSCKVYMVLMYLTAKFWNSTAEIKPVSFKILEIYTGLKESVLKKALQDLIEKKHIIIHQPTVQGQSSEFTIAFNMPKDVLENGV